jgi:hypothetical protein
LTGRKKKSFQRSHGTEFSQGMTTSRLKRLAAAFTVNGWIYKQIPEEKGGFLAVFFCAFCYQFVIDL